MLECNFELNNKPMSTFTLNGKAYPAFSGLGSSINDASATCHKDAALFRKGATTFWIGNRADAWGLSTSFSGTNPIGLRFTQTITTLMTSHCGVKG